MSVRTILCPKPICLEGWSDGHQGCNIRASGGLTPPDLMLSEEVNVFITTLCFPLSETRFPNSSIVFSMSWGEQEEDPGFQILGFHQPGPTLLSWPVIPA